MKPKDDRGAAATPEEWLRHAASDLRLARLGAASAEDVLPQQLCFHAQQAAEKALKALLLHAGIEFPLTHDIEELFEIAEGSGIEFPDEILAAGGLTPFAVQTRYPGYWGRITAADAAEAIALAAKVLTWVKDRLGRD